MKQMTKYHVSAKPKEITDFKREIHLVDFVEVYLNGKPITTENLHIYEVKFDTPTNKITTKANKVANKHRNTKKSTLINFGTDKNEYYLMNTKILSFKDITFNAKMDEVHKNIETTKKLLEEKNKPKNVDLLELSSTMAFNPFSLNKFIDLNKTIIEINKGLITIGSNNSNLNSNRLYNRLSNYKRNLTDIQRLLKENNITDKAVKYLKSATVDTFDIYDFKQLLSNKRYYGNTKLVKVLNYVDEIYKTLRTNPFSLDKLSINTGLISDLDFLLDNLQTNMQEDESHGLEPMLTYNELEEIEDLITLYEDKSKKVIDVLQTNKCGIKGEHYLNNTTIEEFDLDTFKQYVKPKKNVEKAKNNKHEKNILNLLNNTPFNYKLFQNVNLSIRVEYLKTELSLLESDKNIISDRYKTIEKLIYKYIDNLLDVDMVLGKGGCNTKVEEYLNSLTNIDVDLDKLKSMIDVKYHLNFLDIDTLVGYFNVDEQKRVRNMFTNSIDLLNHVKIKFNAVFVDSLTLKVANTKINLDKKIDYIELGLNLIINKPILEAMNIFTKALTKESNMTEYDASMNDKLLLKFSLDYKDMLDTDALANSYGNVKSPVYELTTNDGVKIIYNPKIRTSLYLSTMGNLSDALKVNDLNKVKKLLINDDSFKKYNSITNENFNESSPLQETKDKYFNLNNKINLSEELTTHNGHIEIDHNLNVNGGKGVKQLSNEDLEQMVDKILEITNLTDIKIGRF